MEIMVCNWIKQFSVLLRFGKWGSVELVDYKYINSDFSLCCFKFFSFFWYVLAFLLSYAAVDLFSGFNVAFAEEIRNCCLIFELLFLLDRHIGDN